MPETTKDEIQKRGAREALSSLTEQELLDLWNKLLLFTKRYFNVDREDLIQEAFTAAIGEQRNWRLDISPFHNLCLIIRSIASNRLRKEGRLVQFDRASKSIVADYTTTTQCSSSTYERQETDRSFTTECHRLLSGDVISRNIVDHVIENSDWKPKEIAAALKVQRSEVYSARKRLMRKLKVMGERD